MFVSNGLFGTLKNGLFLIISQAANYILPLIILPHLAKNLSAEKFGGVVFGISVMQILNIIVDFGFSLSGFKIKEDENKNAFYTAVYVIKIAIFFVATLLIGVFIAFSDAFKNHLFLILMWVAAFFSGLAPNWLFSSIENTKPIMYANLIARVFLVVSIFVFVRQDADFDFVGVAFLANNIVVFFISIFLAYKIGFKINIRIKFNTIKSIFFDSLSFFWSRAAVTLYTSASVFFLGLYGGMIEAAKYSIAEQIYKSLQGIFGPISQAMYPYMIRTKNYKNLVYVGCACLFFAGGVALSFIFYGDYVVSAIFGEDAIKSHEVLRIFSWTIMVTSVSIFFGYPLFGALNKLHIANNTVILGGLIQITLIGLMFAFNMINAENVAISVLVAEFSVLSSRVAFCLKIRR